MIALLRHYSRKSLAALFIALVLGLTLLSATPVVYAAPGDAGTASAPASPPPAGAPTGDVAPPSGDSGNAGDVGAQLLGEQTLGEGIGSSDILLQLSKILAVILEMISKLIWPLLMFAGGLLKSDFLYTGAIDLKLTEMWIQVRNLVNIIYVILLLAVALYNVLGLGETVDFLQIKTALPKIILGLLLVNFSYAGVKVVLDVVNVGTTFAFSIGRSDPELTIRTKQMFSDKSEAICNSIASKGAAQAAAALKGTQQLKDDEVKKKAAADAAAAQKLKKDKKACEDNNKGTSKKAKDAKAQCLKDLTPKEDKAASDKTICVEGESGKQKLNPKIESLLSTWNIDGALTIMAVKFMNMQDLSKVAEQIKSAGTLSGLAINMLFSLVMYMVYGVCFISLVIVLFARAAVLWMVIVFSPLIVVNITFPNLVSQLGGAGEMAGKITKTLIAPIIVGFVLSIGYILLSTMQNISYDGVSGYIVDAPVSNLDTFQDLLIAMGSVVFVWMGVNAAISDTIGGSIAGFIMEKAKDAGGWLAKAPFFYTPLFQIKTPHSQHGDVVNLGTLLKAVDIQKGNFDDAQHKKATDLLGRMGLGGGRGLDEINTKDGMKNFIKSQDAAYLMENREKVSEAIKRLESREGKKLNPGDATDKQLIILRDEKDEGKIREALTRLGVGTTSTGGSTAAGAAGNLNTFADKEASKAMLEDGKTYLENTKHSQIDSVIKAEESKYAGVDKTAAKSAIAAVTARSTIAADSEAKAYLKGDATKKDAFKKMVEKQLEAVKDLTPDNQAKVVGDAVKEIIKSDASLGSKKTEIAQKITEALPGNATVAKAADQVKK